MGLSEVLLRDLDSVLARWSELKFEALTILSCMSCGEFFVRALTMLYM